MLPRSALSCRCRLLQIKERYCTREHYGDWLAQNAVTMGDVLASVPEKLRTPTLLGLSPISTAGAGGGAATNGNGRGAAAKAGPANGQVANGNGHGNGRPATPAVVAKVRKDKRMPTASIADDNGAPDAAENSEESALLKILQPLKCFG
jgi:hypothetical protein